jgi:ribosome-associated protein
MQREIKNIDFSPEFSFKTSRSGGPGGQNVNKVNTKVELSFDVVNSLLLLDDEKERILQKLSSKLTSENILNITSQSERTQLKNKAECIKKFYETIEKALHVPKKRRPTKISPAQKERRLEMKKQKSEIKASRRKIE